MRRLFCPGGIFPEKLLQYSATVLGPSGDEVGSVYACTFGYLVKWNTGEVEQVDVDGLPLDKVVDDLKTRLASYSTTVSDEGYTGNPLCDEDIETFTTEVMGERERSLLFCRFYSLLAAIMAKPWYRAGYYSRPSSGLQVNHVRGLPEDCTLPIIRFESDEIRVPKRIIYPYNVDLGIPCGFSVEEYGSLDAMKREGETDMDTVDRLVKTILADFTDKKKEVDRLIAERKEQVIKVRGCIEINMEMALKLLADRKPVDFVLLSLAELGDIHHRLSPGLPECSFAYDDLYEFRSLVEALTKAGSTGILDGDRLTFRLDPELVKEYRDAISKYPLTDKWKRHFRCLDDDRYEASIRLIRDDGRLYLEMVSSDDPADSVHVV